MNMDELLQLGAKLFRDSNLSGNAGSGLDMDSLVSALSGLIGNKGDLDLGSIVNNLDAGGMADIAKSWLGDGDNTTISPDQINTIISPDKISKFASSLGISLEEASGGLSEAIPQIVDKASSGGSLLDSIGGIEGALGLAGKLFGK